VDVTLYEFLLFCHITFVAIWLGGDAMVQVFAFRSFAAGPERTALFMSDVEWIGTRVLTPAALLVVLFGVWMVIKEPAWEFSQFWVTAGLMVFIASFLTGAGFLGPESGRISKLVAARGAEDAEVQNRIELVLLILVVLDMVAKPGL
jgi:uncharacterized membrane protein